MGDTNESLTREACRYAWSIKGRKIDADSLDKFDDIAVLSEEDGILLLGDLKAFSEALADFLRNEINDLSDEELPGVVNLYNSVITLYTQVALKIQTSQPVDATIGIKIESAAVEGGVRAEVKRLLVC